jgi:hypothetical protein
LRTLFHAHDLSGWEHEHRFRATFSVHEEIRHSTIEIHRCHAVA